MTAEADYPQQQLDPYAYANEFNYAQWVPNASVALCNVPWDSSYRDVARFATQADKNAYFDALIANAATLRWNELTIVKFGEPIYLPVPFNTANAFNYLIVDAPLMPVPGENPAARTRYYYFIQNVAYVAPNTTQINVQLDVWQTYYDGVTFHRCYVERGHVGIANENATVENLAKYHTIPEGLDYGNEYETVENVFHSFQTQPPLVVVVSTADLTVDPGDTENPTLKTATGGVYDGLPNGANIYAFTGAHFLDLMDALSATPWVAQCITMLTLVPQDFLDLSTAVTVQGVSGYKLNGIETADSDVIDIDQFFDRFHIPERYAGLKKFYTSPYCALEVTTLSGGEIVLKPEAFSWFNPLYDTRVSFGFISCVSPPHMRVAVYPKFYNGTAGTQENVAYKTVDGLTRNAVIGAGEFLDLAVQIANFPQFSLVNNGYLQYLASTAHGRAYSFDNADWSQSKALRGAQLSYDQTNAGLAAGRANLGASNEAATAHTRIAQAGALFGAGQGLAMGAAGGALSAGPAGAAAGVAMGAANTAATIATAELNNNVNISLANQTYLNNAGATRYNRDTNLEYASWAAQGDYAQAIQAIGAKVQDAKLTQPSTAGQNAGEAFNLSNGLVGVLFKFKRIKEQHIRTIGEFWLRYGYYVNEFMTPPADLAVCDKFTYWKLLEVYVTAVGVPEQYKETIRGIFEKGVTVWRNPADIGQIDPADNDPLPGVSF